MPAREDPLGAAFDLGGLMDQYFPKPTDKVEKSVVWEAKRIDGKYYVSLEQVVELLRVNNVLPKVRKGLERRL